MGKKETGKDTPPKNQEIKKRQPKVLHLESYLQRRFDPLRITSCIALAHPLVAGFA
jgi:hypothetical protein